MPIAAGEARRCNEQNSKSSLNLRSLVRKFDYGMRSTLYRPLPLASAYDLGMADFEEGLHLERVKVSLCRSESIRTSHRGLRLVGAFVAMTAYGSMVRGEGIGTHTLLPERNLSRRVYQFPPSGILI